MTPLTALRRIGAPVASSCATALVFIVVLWVQHARSGWPFDRPDETPQVEDMAGMAATGDANSQSRVPVAAASTQSLDLRLETVGRQSLTQTVRAVATMVKGSGRVRAA